MAYVYGVTDLCIELSMSLLHSKVILKLREDLQPWC